jgi:hypothetical protein
MNADEYLDRYDTAPMDILLAIIAELAATLNDKAHIKIKDNYFVKRFQEIRSFLLSDIELKEAEIPLFEAKMKVQRLQRNPNAREQVRQMLLPHMTSILAEINSVFDEARLQLKKKSYADGEQRYTDIVLILDNLEKIERIENLKQGEESQRALFIERASQLNGLNAHIIYTVPLGLVRSHGPQLHEAYGVPPFVLPMIKVASRGDRVPYEPGRQRMREMLQKRIGATPLEQVFTAEALDFLITYSGGQVRDLMSFVQSATRYVDVLPIDRKAARRALSQTIALYSTSIKSSHWSKLARLELSNDQKIDTDDPDYQAMLEQISIMEYNNGGEDEEAFTDDEPWYAVNPIVRELGRFKSTVAALTQGHSQ